MLPYLCLCAHVIVCDGVCITIHTHMKMPYHQISFSEDVRVRTRADVHVTLHPHWARHSSGESRRNYKYGGQVCIRPDTNIGKWEGLCT